VLPSADFIDNLKFQNKKCSEFSFEIRMKVQIVQANSIRVKMGYTVDTNSGLVQCAVLRYPQRKRNAKQVFSYAIKPHIACIFTHLRKQTKTLPSANISTILGLR
jgi:hypothetical protein